MSKRSELGIGGTILYAFVTALLWLVILVGLGFLARLCWFLLGFGWGLAGG
jgi:hypothetical protein